jgi:hypothetical protein
MGTTQNDMKRKEAQIVRFRDAYCEPQEIESWFLVVEHGLNTCLIGKLVVFFSLSKDWAAGVP